MEKKKNLGCLIGTIVFAIVSIVAMLNDSSFDIAEIGRGIILILGAIVGFLAVRWFLHAIDYNGNIGVGSCIGSVIIGFLVMLSFSWFAESDSNAYVVGVIIISIFTIIIGILFYNSFKNE